MDLTYEEYIDFINSLFLQMFVDFDYQDEMFNNQIERV